MATRRTAGRTARVEQTPDGAEQLEGAEHGPQVEEAPAVEVATEDLLIERPDLGPGAHTLVVAGQPIPVELARLPRQPREQEGEG